MIETSREDLVTFYMKAGASKEEANSMATGYLDALDGIAEGAYFMLKITGPIIAGFTTKAGHSLGFELKATN